MSLLGRGCVSNELRASASQLDQGRGVEDRLNQDASVTRPVRASSADKARSCDRRPGGVSASAASQVSVEPAARVCLTAC